MKGYLNTNREWGYGKIVDINTTSVAGKRRSDYSEMFHKGDIGIEVDADIQRAGRRGLIRNYNVAVKPI